MRRIRNIFNLGNKDTLVMTLLVKNEADIILDNIFFHYSKGVDKIIVTDNGSNDGTLEILDWLDKLGLIYLIKDNSIYAQDKLVNKMGLLAKERFGATILIHSDADEFWNPMTGNDLKKTFNKVGQSALSVDRHDVLPTPEAMHKKFPQKSLNIITKHLISDTVETDSKKVSIFLFRLPPKVMFSVKNNLKKVDLGNHNLVDYEKPNISSEVTIFHFPFKSYDRFVEKVVMSGRAISKLKTPEGVWWHWKRWYKSYMEGSLDGEIKLLIPELDKILNIKYEPFNYEHKIIKSIKKNKQYGPLYSQLNKELG